VVHGIEAVTRTENALALLQLCAIGLRIAADELAKHARPRKEPDGQVMHDWAGTLVTTARRAGEDSSRDAESAALERLCEAEDRRLRNADTVELWGEVAESWSGLGRPYHRAYALLRGSEAAARAGDKDAASAAARTAHSIAEKLGAQPLQGQIDSLVKHHRLKLADAPTRKAHPFNLTQRELDVLGEVTIGGLSNHQIARKLHISEKTVSVHMHRIFRKLEVRSRAEAAAKARKHGLFDD
jgi:ATP/maltotriose-dependent transcriptional regulator MalT